MRNSSDIIKVQNRDNGTVGYSIPDLNNLHRTYMPGEIKQITMDELRKLSYVPGGMEILRNYLVILDDEAREEILNDVEPEYYLTKDGVKDLLINGSIDALLDCLDFAPIGVIDLVKEVAVEIELNDVKKRDAILDKTGFNVTSAININKETTEEVEKVKPVRRLGEKEEKVEAASTGRRTATPSYKIISTTK